MASMVYKLKSYYDTDMSSVSSWIHVSHIRAHNINEYDSVDSTVSLLTNPNNKITKNLRLRNWDEVRNIIIKYDMHPVDYHSNNGDSLLHMAIQCSAPIEIIKELLEYIDISSVNTNGKNVLHTFIDTIFKYTKPYAYELLNVLLNLGADVNCISSSGFTPYLLARFNLDNDNKYDYITEIMKLYGADISYVKTLYKIEDKMV